MLASESSDRNSSGLPGPTVALHLKRGRMMSGGGNVGTMVRRGANGKTEGFKGKAIHFSNIRGSK
jgi:spore maturation protein SpmB